MKMKLYLFFLLSWVYVINMGAETYVQLMNPNDSDSCTTGLIYLNTSDQAPLSDSTKSSDSNKKIPQDSIGIRNSVPNEQGITIFNQGRQWGIPRGTTNGAITCKQDGTWDWLVRPVVSYEKPATTTTAEIPEYCKEHFSDLSENQRKVCTNLRNTFVNQCMSSGKTAIDCSKDWNAELRQ